MKRILQSLVFNFAGNKVNDFFGGVFAKSDVNTAEVFEACRMGERTEKHPVRVNIKTAKRFPRTFHFVAAARDDESVRCKLVVKR